MHDLTDAIFEMELQAQIDKVDSLAVLDICGGSGAWSKPYADNGYSVYIIDVEDVRQNTSAKLIQMDVRDPHLIYRLFALNLNIHGILAAPPCTHFAGSGAQYWKVKDADGRTESDILIIKEILKIINSFSPYWWALENPIGRIPKLIPELGDPVMYFQPWEYGDPWTKKTCLWGNFNDPEKNPVEPVKFTKQGSWTQKLGGKSSRTKFLRSMTPPGFARAFFESNP